VTKGTVVGVPSGDTVVVKLPAKGKTKARNVRIHVLGVVAPAGASCYSADATARTRSLALGKTVTLAGDLKCAYVALPGGVDLGRELIVSGAAQVDNWNGDFTRLTQYAPLQLSAEKSGAGMWKACSSDISVSVTGAKSANPGDYVTYFATVTNNGPLTAPAVKVEVRPGSYQKTMYAVNSPTATCENKNWVGYCTITGIPSGGESTIFITIRPTQAGAMSARATATLVGCAAAQCGSTPLHDSNLLNDRAAQPTIIPGGIYGLPGKECDPSYPTVCLPPPPPDIDCADFAPLRAFPVRRDVADPDPHHLDGDGNGIACEGDDY
jgi:endonuclease YncB( thermonuclease family)